MANTTFNGPVRSENGLKTISKNATTGVLTEQIVASSGGVLEVQKVATSGSDNIVAAGTTVGANNASLGTAATIFNITPNAHGSGLADAAINTQRVENEQANIVVGAQKAKAGIDADVKRESDKLDLEIFKTVTESNKNQPS